MMNCAFMMHVLLRRESTIHGHDAARHPTGIVGKQEGDDVGDVFRLADAQEMPFFQVRLLLVAEQIEPAAYSCRFERRRRPRC